MRNQAKNILFFPIDTVSRELEWQFILALESAKRYGTISLIGHKPILKKYHRNSKNCVWIGRLATKNSNAQLFKVAYENNNSILFLHDEGAFYPNKTYEKSVLQNHPLDVTQPYANIEFLTWGDRQKEILENTRIKYNFKRFKIYTSGIPRFDLYNSKWDWIDEDRVNELNNNYGSFDLIITKFGNANSSEHIGGMIDSKFLKANRFINDDYMTDEFFTRWEKDHVEFASFVKMLRSVFKIFPDKNFILRPHPSEDTNFYQQVFGNYSNVLIRRKGDIRPWIKAAESIIHTGCTTGVEGVLGGKKVINFIPRESSSPYDISIADEAGIWAKTSNEVIELLNGKSFRVTNEFSSDAKAKLYNLTGDAIPNVLERIKQHLNKEKNAEVQIENRFIRNLKYLKNSFKNKKEATKRGLKNKEVGRNTRLSPLPKERLYRILNDYNERNGTNLKIHLMDSKFLVVGPSQ